jgi:hypothetical protein
LIRSRLIRINRVGSDECSFRHWLRLPEYLVRLLRNAHERSSLRQLAQPPRSNVGARRAHAAQYLLRSCRDRTAEGHEHFLTLGRAILCHAARVFLHRGPAAHPVEALVLLAAALDAIARAFVVAGEHPAEHHEVSTTTECLGDVA